MQTAEPSIADVRAEEWQALSSRRIFFGHQSVGRDIVNGIRQVLAANPKVRLNLVESGDPAAVAGPAFIEARIGRNREPVTKSNAFAAILHGGFGSEAGAIAMYKFCYVDIQPDTDPEAMFDDYAGRIEELRRMYPALVLVHFTMPLRTSPTGVLERTRTRLGMMTETGLNLKRGRYNELVRARYGRSEPVFDLAMIESTRPDGSLACSSGRGGRVGMLASDWTTDGGHLNERAQYRVAERLLTCLARLVEPESGRMDRASAGVSHDWSQTITPEIQR